MTKTIDELNADFDMSGYRKEYTDLQRTEPRLADQVEKMVNAGIAPFNIADRYFQLNPHRWPQSRIILSAARYLRGQLER